MIRTPGQASCFSKLMQGYFAMLKPSFMRQSAIGHLCVLLFAVHSATAQSDADLRRANQALTTQVADLTKELDALKATNAQLKDRITQLESQLAAARRAASNSSGGVLPPLEEPAVSIDETLPHSSPRAMFKAIHASHNEAVKDLEKGKAGDSKRRGYLRKLEQWKAGAERNLRGPIRWNVREVDRRNSGANQVWTLVAVDPKTDAELGDAFEVMLPRPVADRLTAFEKRGELGQMVLRGVAMPTLRVNEARADRGSFDKPRFVGPFVEYVLMIEPKSLLPVKDDADEQKNQPDAAARPAAKPTTTSAPDANK
jgi:cell division protein FtsB